MKNKLMLRLCLIMIALLFFQSCRQDMLPEKETYNNTSAFQLSSKRISLSESKHKTKLLHEIEQVEIKFKTFSKTNAQGKAISYANGVSIDTDNVTYIENGPNYHTYTFNLTRDNALPTDTVENLVLTPLADGSYKELLVTYNLTPQEKEALMMGASVDTKGKTTITELAEGTFNSGGQLARFNCGYQSTTVWVNCCHGYHNPTNVDDWASCVCPPEGQPHVYTVVSYVCAPVFETIMPTDPGGSSGGGGGGVGGSTPPCTDCPPETQTPTEPCNGNGVLTGPFDPALSPGDGGCGGVVTTPTLPILGDDPCVKTSRSITAANTVLNSTEGQQMTTVLQAKVGDPVEWAMGIGQLPNNGAITITSAAPGGQYQGSVPSVPAGYNAVGDGHSHAKDIASPSGGDLYRMLEGMFTSTYGAPNPNFKYRFVYGYGQNTNVKETYALVINDITLAQQFWDAFPMSENYDPLTHSFKKGSDLEKEIYKIKTIYSYQQSVSPSAEYYHRRAIGLAYILDKFNAGIILAKADANGNLKKINASVVKGGPMGEKAIISKCP